MIDWARVSELRDEVGAEDFDEVVELLLEEVDEAIAALRDLMDLSKLEPQCHFLKGSPLNIGFREFANLCQAEARPPLQRHWAKMWKLPPLCKAMQQRAKFS